MGTLCNKMSAPWRLSHAICRSAQNKIHYNYAAALTVIPSRCRLLQSLLPKHLPQQNVQFQTCASLFNKESAVTVKVPRPEPQVDELYKTITVEVRGHDPQVLNSYEYFTNKAAELLGVTVDKSYTPRKIIERKTLLKSKHNYGKYHKVQYERRTHFKVLVLKRLTGSTADTYLEYIQRNLPEGVAMKVTKERLDVIPEHIKPPTDSTEETQ